ncbi:MAG: histidine triad nucleotide-binding protein [bacterium]|nr:histidine triad nucleotide-binding protein [bacterium]MDD5757056.1 histidine triad nucleotide-binding protein [bacterium]
MTECLFCKIIEKKIPAKIAYEDDKVLAFHDISPKAPVHILIIPKKHISAVNELTDQDGEIIGYLHLIAKKLAKENKIDKSGFRLVINNGPDAGQAVGHIHLHVLGGRKLQWPPG